jgi:hypothetical protein
VMQQFLDDLCGLDLVSNYVVDCIDHLTISNVGHAVVLLVEALCYIPEGPVFDFL